MAISLTSTGLDVVLDAGRTYFQQKRDQLHKARAHRKVYLATRYELSKLSDRDLKDLGIARSNIKRLAMEAAYDS